MTVVAVCSATGGVGVTTTTVALAGNWPADNIAVAELDPTGGDLAAWCDAPDTTGTAALAVGRWDGTIDTLDDECWSPVGTRTRALCGPTRRVAAEAVIDVVATKLVRGFAASDQVLLIDCGQLPASALPSWIGAIAAIAVVVRQDSTSSLVSATRLDRSAELIDSLRAHGLDVFALSIGERPFPMGEVSAYLNVPTLALATDPLGASLIANSAAATRSLERCALYRSARSAATRLAATTDLLPVDECAS